MTRYLSILAAVAWPVFAQQSVPAIAFTSVPNYPSLPPGMNFGEVAGVAVNSKGHVFVFSRSNSATGPAFGAAAAQLLEFDQKGTYLREIGKACMPGRRRIACESTRTITSGLSTKALT